MVAACKFAVALIQKDRYLIRWAGGKAVQVPSRILCRRNTVTVEQLLHRFWTYQAPTWSSTIKIRLWLSKTYLIPCLQFRNLRWCCQNWNRVSLILVLEPTTILQVLTVAPQLCSVESHSTLVPAFATWTKYLSLLCAMIKNHRREFHPRWETPLHQMQTIIKTNEDYPYYSF